MAETCPTLLGFTTARPTRRTRQLTDSIMERPGTVNITRTFARCRRKRTYDRGVNKRITDSQVLGELGETAVKKIVLEMQFIYDPRGRLSRDPAFARPHANCLAGHVG
jgi:hypothetical protein